MCVMIENEIHLSQPVKVLGIFSQAIYVDDFEKSKTFYSELFGLAITSAEGSCGCFLGVGENPQAIYLEGGHPQKQTDAAGSNVSFMMRVADARTAFNDLKGSGVRVVQPEPVHMGGGAYWFQFFDPSGNLLEMVSM
jgi:predicted enzyme related to lactoylglutathione lyase